MRKIRTGAAAISLLLTFAFAVSAQAGTWGQTAGARVEMRPFVTITSPANGATVTSSPVTVTGTAGASLGVKSVSVNGVGATLSGSHWTASVPLKPGQNTLTATMTPKYGGPASATLSGSHWTASVPLKPGQNTLTATMTPKYGGPATDSVTVTYSTSHVTPPQLTLVSKRFNGKAVLVKLACASGGSSCAGVITLRYTETVVRHHKKHRVTLVLGGTHYAVAAGHTSTIAADLTGTAKRLLKTRHKLATTGTVTLIQASGHATTAATFKLTLKRT